MGLPALRDDKLVSSRRSHLRVVESRPAAPNGRRSHAQAHAAAVQAFTFFAVVIGLLCTLGLGRVWLSVQAEQASIDSGTLRREIKLERFQGDMLEVQQSSLAAPSRIQAVAGSTMNMAAAGSVSYLDLRDAPSGAPVVAASARTGASTALSGALAKAMEVAASEANVLLVGDVGLATSR